MVGYVYLSVHPSVKQAPPAGGFPPYRSHETRSDTHADTHIYTHTRLTNTHIQPTYLARGHEGGVEVEAHLGGHAVVPDQLVLLEQLWLVRRVRGVDGWVC